MVIFNDIAYCIISCAIMLLHYSPAWCGASWGETTSHIHIYIDIWRRLSSAVLDVVRKGAKT